MAAFLKLTLHADFATAAAPAMPCPCSLTRTLEQTQQAVPTGPWCLSPGSRYEYGRLLRSHEILL